jgi:hypothetical protein
VAAVKQLVHFGVPRPHRGPGNGHWSGSLWNVRVQGGVECVPVFAASRPMFPYGTCGKRPGVGSPVTSSQPSQLGARTQLRALYEMFLTVTSIGAGSRAAGQQGSRAAGLVPPSHPTYRDHIRPCVSGRKEALLKPNRRAPSIFLLGLSTPQTLNPRTPSCCAHALSPFDHCSRSTAGGAPSARATNS